jgi:hypothetical protein
MRCLVLIAIAVCFVTTAHAQKGEKRTLSDFALQAQDAFSKAKNASEVENIKSWCKAGVVGETADQRIVLIQQMRTLIEADKLREANVLLEKMKSLDDQDENMVALVCKPR